jgi:ankyrin repeat protein
VDNGAALDVSDTGGETPLHWAALNGRLEVLSYLLERGVNINGVAESGFTALHAATINSHVKCISLLLSKGVDVEAKDKKGMERSSRDSGN